MPDPIEPDAVERCTRVPVSLRHPLSIVASEYDDDDERTIVHVTGAQAWEAIDILRARLAERDTELLYARTEAASVISDLLDMARTFEAQETAALDHPRNKNYLANLRATITRGEKYLTPKDSTDGNA
jgi:hypothetical protein